MDARELFVRRQFVGILLGLEGYPYVWGKEFDPPSGGGDCSGIGTGAGWMLDLWPRSRRWTSRTIHREWEPVNEPQIGDAVTYAILPHGILGAALVTHVMWVTGGPIYRIDGAVSHKVWPVIGATGGGRLTTTVAKAREKGARVRRYGTHEYRNYVAGFRRLPIPREALA